MFGDLTAPDPWLWDVHIHPSSDLVDAGDPGLQDPDGGPVDIGAFGGDGADGWDLDRDEYPAHWQPGPYDWVNYPAQGWDCDDRDKSTYPGNGC